MSWNPSTYLTFAEQRTRPAAELLSRIRAENPARVIDLGCGPGNSTALLAARWPKTYLEGLDNSPAMLAEASASGVTATWVEADLAEWAPAQPYDVIFSNATLQWLPGQDRLLPRLISFVKAGGTFAFQVPVNFDAPSHRLMRETAQDPRWRERLSTVREIERGRAKDYYALLKPHAPSLDIWQTKYLQVMEGEDAVYRWVSGTGLRPFLDALVGEQRDAFIALYKAKLNQAYPRRADGSTLFPFERLFVVAEK
ncbi:MAG TPA: methyltransferase domain-containing protein [Rhizomicrobium sp.]|nr:methyltransferase domain-containing protein [Rhizomicrobium sp.]